MRPATDKGQDMNVTKQEVENVVFRKYPDGEIVALFPDIPADPHGRYVLGFQHIGQHGGADYDYVVSQTVPATDAEAADLKAELEGPQYGYVLKVCKKRPPRR